MIGIPSRQRFGFFAPVRLDNADHDLGALLQFLLRRLQHRVGLPHPGDIPKKIFSLPRVARRFFALHLREDLIRIRAIRLTHLRIATA